MRSSSKVFDGGEPFYKTDEDRGPTAHAFAERIEVDVGELARIEIKRGREQVGELAPMGLMWARR